MIFIGIDPDLGGAVAIHDTRRSPGLPGIADTPVALSDKRTSLTALMADVLRPYAESGTRAYIELPQGRTHPRRVKCPSCQRWFAVHVHAKGELKTGQLYGEWLGILAAFQISHEPVRPQDWKRRFGVKGKTMRAAKEAARLKAIELFPEVADQLRLKKHHGRAESLLIAEYGRRVSGSQ